MFDALKLCPANHLLSALSGTLRNAANELYDLRRTPNRARLLAIAASITEAAEEIVEEAERVARA